MSFLNCWQNATVHSSLFFKACATRTDASTAELDRCARSFLAINVKNFHGSLTTVVRSQNDTSKTANITHTIFDRTYWYSPYKRWRFKNRWDQTFCILLITECSVLVQTSANAKIRNKSDPGFVFGLIGSGCPSYPSQNCGYIMSSASVISPSMVQIGCWLYENWENGEMLTNVRKSPIPRWWRKQV